MNAVILAAGMGTRLRPLTESIPKTLVPVLGEPIIERQIRFLKEAGVGDILVVTGYLHEKLEYLERAYGVELVHNEMYDVHNNIYSMYLVRDHLGPTYVLEGDVYLTRNVFLDNVSETCYFAGPKVGFRQEWIVHFDESERVVGIEIGDGEGVIMSGVSYWNASAGQKVRALVEDAVRSGACGNLVWDHLVKDNLSQFSIRVHKLAADDWYEIDSVEDLQRVEQYLAGWRGGN